MYVLDASVVLAMAKDEPDSESLSRYLDGALISAVNYSEVVQKFAQLGVPIETARLTIDELDLGVVPFDADMAAESAKLWALTHQKGLSLADRACLALAGAMNGIAVTADRAWANLDIPGVNIHVIPR